MQTKNQRQQDKVYKLGTTLISRSWLIEFLMPVVVFIIGISAFILAVTIFTNDHRVIAGAVLSFVALSIVWRYIIIGLFPHRSVEIRADMEYIHSIDLSDAVYAGVSPKNIRVDITWDTGYLLIESGSMKYYGERVSFELAPEQVQDVQLIDRWWEFWSYPYLKIFWCENPESPTERFSIAVYDSANIHKRTAEIMERIKSWKMAGAVMHSTQNKPGLPRETAYNPDFISPLSVPRIPAGLAVLTHLLSIWTMICLVLIMGYLVYIKNNAGSTDIPMSYNPMFSGLLFLALTISLFSWMKNRD